MVDPALVRKWIDKADEDFRFAEVNLKEPVLWPTHYSVGEAERAYKAAEGVRNFIMELLKDFLK